MEKRAGNFEKAARTYLKVANNTPDISKRKDLLSRAYKNAKKSEKLDFVFKCAKEYYLILVEIKNVNEINNLIPEFSTLSNSLISHLNTMNFEEKLEILQWSLTLAENSKDNERSFEISLLLGDLFFDAGKKLLSVNHLVGKEEKYNQGIEHYSKAIEAYNKISLNSFSASS